ncbi:MAG: recombinase family protein [Bacteroidaceae bacterium]|nr:recombinase family protein [Bacteroidaceae bacterium]
MEEPTRVCIYARVSTSAQDYQHQLTTLRAYAKEHHYQVVKEYTEKISGAKKIADRQALSELLEEVETNHIQKILVFECSRLSRRALDFLAIIEQLNEKKVSVFFYQNGLETLLPDLTVNPIASLVLGIMSQFNSLERNLIRSRMANGYDNYRQNGGTVGRKVGYRKTNYQEEYAKEISLLKKGVSLRDCRSLTHTSINTLRKLKSLFM